ncbi:MAG: putative porin [Flavobacteriaceae bacterium]|nr:putative porin [Flavobacteriaceae bacterium]MBT6447853.1 putative porin [Flavobacteriaceae bacterium]
MKFYSFFIIIFFSSLSFLYSQENDSNQDPLLIEDEVEKKNILLNTFKKKKDTLNSILPNIRKYVIINANRDSTYLDTTLTIKKHYKFNYLRKDNFELLKYSNIGQTYNELTHNFDFLSFLPKFSFSSKNHAYLKSNEIKYFQVPTPLTELLFKTVMKQGQHTDAFFSSNISEKFNFSIAFKGLRSLGNYQNILSGSKQFRFTTKYNSSNNRYNFRLHFVSQGFENQENGGLTDESITNFESEDPLFNERSKLSAKFEDAVNYFSSKRYYLDHQFLLTKKKDSTQKNSFSIGHRFEYETINNTYEQDQASEFYGIINSGLNGISDKSEIKTTLNEFYTDLNSNFLGKIQVIYTNYNYRYKSNSLSNEFDGFNQNENALSFKFNRNIFGHHLKATVSNSLFGDRLGNLINATIVSNKQKKFKYEFGLNISSKHPGFYYELYKSGYTDINWKKDINKTQIENIFLKFKSIKFGDLRFDFRLIDNYTYFSLISQNKTLKPVVNQLGSSIDYLKIKWNKEFKFGKFALDNSLVYQKVNQDGDYLNIPVLLSRNTIYYSNTILKGAMFFQTGISIKYFSKYYSNEYNPIISSFHIQNEKKIGGFPLVDLFVNAKIKQTRLFLKAEHFNSTFTGNNFYSSPSYPYRDFIIRFGLVWNFFN